LSLYRLNLRNASTVTIFGKLTSQPRFYDLSHLRAVDGAAAKRQHIGPVVLARIAGNGN
jgi:hypothetical protein